MCASILCVHEKTSRSLGRSDYQCPQYTNTCRIRNIPFEKQTNSSVHRKRLKETVTNVFIAKRAATFLTVLLRTNHRKLCCLTIKVHITWSKSRVLITKMENRLHFRRNHPSTTTKHARTGAKRAQFFPIMA